MTSQNVKQSQQRYGITWYKAVKKKSGINEHMNNLRENRDDLYIIKRHHPSWGLYWGIADEERIKKMLTKNVYLYEILAPDMKKKVYFDIDASGEVDPLLLEKCKECILGVFPSARMQVSGSRTEQKTSYHIVLSNYFTTDTSLIKVFAAANQSLGFDTAVYGKYQSFKCINQSKPKADAPIQAYIEGSEDLTKHLVMTNFDGDAKDIDSLQLLKNNDIADKLKEIRNPRVRAEYASSSRIDLLSINAADKIHEVPIDFDYINAKAIDKLKLIRLLPRGDKNTLTHNVIWKVMVWACSEQITFQEFWEWCKQKEDTEERKCRYMSYWECAPGYTTHESFIDTILLKMYPFLKEDRSRKLYRRLNELCPTKILESPYLEANDIDPQIKTSVLSIRMGGNKSGAVIDYIKQHPKMKVLFISPRIALSVDIMARMTTAGITNDEAFTLYNTVKDKTELRNFERLIICINSLIHLADTHFDMVVIDEIETVWNVFKGDAKTLCDNGSGIWCILTRLLKNATKVIVMDALMSTKTVNVLKEVDPDGTMEIVTLKKQQEDRYFFPYKQSELQLWLNAVKKSVEDGEKVFIFMPYKTTYANSARHQLAGVKQLVEWICHSCKLTEDVDVIGYYAEQKKQKEALSDIERVWGNARVIVANTCISVGNNYSGGDYSRVFAYFSSWVDIREFIQILYRIRNPKDKVMHIYSERKRNITDEYCPHKLVIEDAAFKELKKGFMIEDRTDGKMRLDVLSKRCNIKLAESNELFDRVKSIHEKIELGDFTIKYTDVEDITRGEYTMIRNDIEIGYVTLYQRLKYEKYRLKKKFLDTTPEDVMAIVWKTNENVITRLDELKKKSEHIINKIFDVSDFTHFVTHHTRTQLSTMYVPKNLTNNIIKDNFKLKYGLENRGVELVARLVNGFFSKRVMYIEKDKSKKCKKIYVRSSKKQVLEYKLDESFVEIVNVYKTYTKLGQDSGYLIMEE